MKFEFGIFSNIGRRCRLDYYDLKSLSIDELYKRLEDYENLVPLEVAALMAEILLRQKKDET